MSLLPDRENGQVIFAEWFNSIKSCIDSLGFKVTNINSDYSIAGSDSVLLVDASSNSVEITLPDASLSLERSYKIVVKDAMNPISIVPQAGNILGESSYNLRMQFESLTLFTDGVDWYAA